MFLIGNHSMRMSGYDERFLRRLETVLEQTLRILTEFHNAKLTFTNCPFPAATNMRTHEVMIDRNTLMSVKNSTRRVKLAKGLLYHESGHLFWSLDENGLTTLSRFGGNEGFSHSEILGFYNEIEDKRIENLFVARYAPAREYYAVPLGELILRDDLDSLSDRQVAAVWMSAVGRPWLGADPYAKLRSYVVGRLTMSYPGFVRDTELIVNEYLRLSRADISAWGGTGHQLIVQWAKLHRLIAEEVKGGCGGERPGEKADKAEQRDRDDDADTKSDKLDDSKADEALNPADDSDDDSEGTPEAGAGEDDFDADANGSDTGGDDDGSSKDGTSDSTTPSDDGSSTGTSASEVADSTDDALNEAEALIDADVDATLDAIHSRIDEVDPAEPSSKEQIWITHEEPVTSTMQVVSRHISTELQEIRTQAASEWLRGTDVGRLNPMKEEFYGDERLDVFDLFDEGTEDEMRCHVVFGIDQSFSMHSRSDGDEDAPKPYVAAAQVAWIFSEAFQRLDHVVDIYGYDERYQRLDEHHKRTTYPVRHPSGGTSPMSMLKDMTRMSLAKRDVTDRLLVILTDGSWGVADADDHDQYVKALAPFRKAGGTAVLFGLESREMRIFTSQMSRGIISEDEPYGFNEWHLIQEPMDLLDPVRSIVKQLMSSHLRGR